MTSNSYFFYGEEVLSNKRVFFLLFKYWLIKIGQRNMYGFGDTHCCPFKDYFKKGIFTDLPLTSL